MKDVEIVSFVSWKERGGERVDRGLAKTVAEGENECAPVKARVGVCFTNVWITGGMENGGRCRVPSGFGLPGSAGKLSRVRRVLKVLNFARTALF